MFRVANYDEVSSTNDLVKRAIEAGESEGYAVCARRQTGGYGRQGRTWSSPEGGLYLSVLLRPNVLPAQLPTLSLVAALAVRRALIAALSRTAYDANNLGVILVKWPNDLVVAGSSAASFRKLCGISLEVHAGGVCVGIGVNVFRPADARESTAFGKNVPVYLEELGFCGTLDGLAISVLGEFDQAYERWLDEGFSCFCTEYDQCAALAGSRVALLDRDGFVIAEGRVEGVDETGRLLLCASDGSLFAANSGEVHIA